MYGAITITAGKMLMRLTEMHKHRVKNIYYLSIYNNECTRTYNNHITSNWGEKLKKKTLIGTFISLIRSNK